MRIENWKEFERDCDLLGYDVFAAETEAQLQYGEDAFSDTIDYTDADGVNHSKLVSQSGMDGSFLLIDDNIEVLG